MPESRIETLPTTAGAEFASRFFPPEAAAGAAPCEAFRQTSSTGRGATARMMSARNVESLHGLYRNAPRTLKRLAPEEIGEPRIGHFGFFRARFRESLWRQHLLPELG